MSLNKVTNFILNVSQNAKLNREKLIQNKKKYHNLLATNYRKTDKLYYNYISKRKISSENIKIHYFKQPKMDPYKKFGLLMLALGIYIIDGKFTSE